MAGKPLSIQWAQGISDPDKKTSFESAIRNATTALGRLKEILVDKQGAVSAKETKIEAYENASWAYRQAHINGYRQCLKEMAELLSFLD